MNQEPTLRYTRVRKVKGLVRANAGDAGLDFFIPENLTVRDFLKAQPEQVVNTFGIAVHTDNHEWVLGNDHFYDKASKQHLSVSDFESYLKDGIIRKIIIRSGSRALIPSGIRVLITPRASMLMAANKSGISTQQGVIFGAEIVDSPYTGEVHISIINTSVSEAIFEAGKKATQFIHVPIYDTEPEEIPGHLYASISDGWGTRGDKAFGSSDNQQPELPLDYEEELAIRDAQYAN